LLYAPEHEHGADERADELAADVLGYADHGVLPITANRGSRRGEMRPVELPDR